MREIPKSQVVARMTEDNAWWEAPHKVLEPFAAWGPRPYLDIFLPHFVRRDVRRALVLLGPRRVGKTVMIHHAIQALLDKGVPPRSICYISVDHPIYNGLGLQDLMDIYSEAAGLNYREEDCHVIFDEIQYLRDWEVHVKALVDRYEHPRIVASGSAAAALRLKSRESGAGRMTEFLLPPLTFHEFLELSLQGHLVSVVEHDDETPTVRVPDIESLNKAFIEYLNFGGYPEVVLSPSIRADPARFIKSDIIDKVLLRDLPSLYGIHDIQELNSLFTTLAYNSGGEVSLEALSRKSGVAKNTLKRYVEYLEAAFLVRVVHRIDRNARRFKRATTFKVYLTNPSIRTALFAPVQQDDESIGDLVETAIYAQWFHSDTADLHYARWKTGEVDMVYLGLGGKPEWAVEAKWSDRDPSDLSRQLVLFCQENGLTAGTVTTKSSSFGFSRDGLIIEGMPSAEYCYRVGLNLVRSKQFEATLPRIEHPPHL